MFCRHCGKEIPDDVLFCPRCGKPVKAKQQEQLPSSQSEQKAAKNFTNELQQQFESLKTKLSENPKLKKGIIAGALAFVVLVIGINVYNRMPRTINLDKYLSVTFPVMTPLERPLQ